MQVLSPALSEETRTMTVRIQPDHAALTPGAAAKAPIVVRTGAMHLSCPYCSAKDPQTGSPLVYVAVADGKYKAVPVTIKLQSGDRTAIAASALQPGARVVTQGAYELLPMAAGSSGD